jgi:hypothetical protein
MKIIIKEDPSCEMLSIETDDGKLLFYGNEWDFDRGGSSFKELFENLGIETELIKTKFEEI